MWLFSREVLTIDYDISGISAGRILAFFPEICLPVGVFVFCDVLWDSEVLAYSFAYLF